MCFALFGSKCISWLLPDPMPGGMRPFPGKEIQAQGLRKALVACSDVDNGEPEG